MKCSKSGTHLTDEDRFLLEKHWNVPDGRRHPSIRAVAKALGLSEATLRREPKRGCAIRFFYPRPTDFSKISQKRIKALRRKLTAYPRPTKTRKAA